MHHTMDGLEMLDPASSMTTLTPMSETPSITSPHHQLHGSYHGMNHYHHGGPLGGHTPGMNHYGNHFFHLALTHLYNFFAKCRLCVLFHSQISFILTRVNFHQQNKFEKKTANKLFIHVKLNGKFANLFD